MSATERFQRALELHQAGHLAEAEKEYRALLADKPDDVNALANLAAVCGATGRLSEAIACWREAERLAPTSWLVGFNLGIVLAASGQFDEAIASYQRALLHAPQPAEVLHQIGLVLRASGRLADARLTWEQALAHDSSNPVFWFHHGLTCAELGDFPRALASADRTLTLKSEHVEALNLRGAVLRDLHRDTEAEECLRKAIELKPDYAPALNNYGLALTESGKADDAIQMFRRALAGYPKSSADHSNLLLALNYSAKISDSDLFAEHRRWAELYADGLASTAPSAPRRQTNGGRLRIGYVSTDFCSHPASLFTTAFLPHHDRREFHVFAYSDVQNEDETTRRIRSIVETWRPILGLSDEQVAKLIRDDGIDILVDLSGHTAGNRLLVFARQPAPIQAAVYVYPNTTGLRTVQYRTTDEFLDPPGLTESYYTEKLIRLPRLSWCYSPRDEAPPVSPPPVSRAGHFTYGSLNNPAKVTDEVIALWARILNAVPRSKLLVAVGRSSLGRKRVEMEFAKAGVTSNRMEILNRMSVPEYLKLFERIDLALDPFPYNGVTTTCDTLWMGVPVVTLAGASCRSRHGVSLLSNIGFKPFIAKDPEDYVRIATSWASREDEIGESRAALRDRVRESPIVRGDLYAARLEAAFRQMWSDAGHA